MKQIKFFQELVPLVLNGSKTSTWRIDDDKNLSVGDKLEFVVTQTKEIFAHAIVTETKILRFKDLTDDDRKGHEDYPTKKVMLETYEKYYSDKKLSENTTIKIVRFKLISS